MACSLLHCRCHQREDELRKIKNRRLIRIFARTHFSRNDAVTNSLNGDVTSDGFPTKAALKELFKNKSTFEKTDGTYAVQ